MDFIRFFIQKTGETSAQWQDRLIRSANSLASRIQGSVAEGIEGLESRVTDLETDVTGLDSRVTDLETQLPVALSPVATTSGTSVTLASGLPSWARKVTIRVVGISTNGTSGYIFQLGTSGGFITSGYTGAGNKVEDAAATAGNSNGSGFRAFVPPSAAATLDGAFTLELHDSSTNTWVIHGLAARSVTTASNYIVSGSIALSGVLTQIRITTTGGADTFDAGSASVRYEY